MDEDRETSRGRPKCTQVRRRRTLRDKTMPATNLIQTDTPKSLWICDRTMYLLALTFYRPPALPFPLAWTLQKRKPTALVPSRWLNVFFHYVRSRCSAFCTAILTAWDSESAIYSKRTRNGSLIFLPMWKVTEPLSILDPSSVWGLWVLFLLRRILDAVD